MKKKILGFLSVFVGIFFITTGCSNDDNTNIKSIDLLKNSIETEYTVLDEVNIEDMLFIVSFDDDRVLTYKLSSDLFEYSQIDNSKVGKQELLIKASDGDYEEDFTVTFNFKLPEEVKSINEDIMKLPISERLSFNDESLLKNIAERYSKLKLKYKPYVLGYDELEDKIDYLNTKKQESITTDVLNQRYAYINYLEKMISSLNQSNYSLSAREEIDRIYVEAVKMLNDDDNYNLMYQIVNEAKENILKVKNNKEEALAGYQKYVVNNLIDYRNSFDMKLYSYEANIKFESILLEGIEAISAATSNTQADRLYGEYCNKFNSILTAEKEKVETLNNTIKDKLYETTQYFLSIDMNEYDNDDRQLLKNYLNDCQYQIKNALNNETINKAVNEFINKVKDILTINEKSAILFNQYKQSSKKDLSEFYATVNLYSYDTKNMIEIENIYNTSMIDVSKCTTYEEVDLLVNNTISKINSFLTLEEQAIINLGNRIVAYNQKIDEYLYNYNKVNYSEDNWNSILQIINNLKKYINNITISTSDKIVNNYMQSQYDLIASVLTVDAEYKILLENTINNSIKQINDYYSSLNYSLYTESQLSFIENKVNNVISIIKTLDNVNSIDKLVSDTIESIQLI